VDDDIERRRRCLAWFSAERGGYVGRRSGLFVLYVELVSEGGREESAETRGALIDVDVDTTVVGEACLGIDAELAALLYLSIQLAVWRRSVFEVLFMVFIDSQSRRLGGFTVLVSEVSPWRFEL